MAPEKGDSLKARLVTLMRANDINLGKASGRLLLMLCKDNCMGFSLSGFNFSLVYRMVYHIGYGNAAGFMFNSGALGQYQQDSADFHAQKELKEGASSDEEEIFNSQEAGFNPITGMAEEGIPAGADMTEEEKEQEKQRLLELFEKLEKTGVMKVMPQ